MGSGTSTADCKECSLDNMKMRYKLCNKCILDYYIEYSDYISSDTFNYHVSLVSFYQKQCLSLSVVLFF